MPTYFPIDQPVLFKTSISDLVAFEWATSRVRADFLLSSGSGRLMRVEFDAACIVRLLDEMPLSTEDDNGPLVGLVAEHFAYRVEGARFASDQSAAWKRVHAPVVHYRFITGWTCLDVLTHGVPRLLVVDVRAGSGA